MPNTNRYSSPTGDIGSHLEVKMSSRRRETSKFVKLPEENQIVKSQDDELVRHMSNLPTYLQRVEKGKMIQEKALHFGVLDWEHLEKLKSNRKCTPPRGNTNPSSSISNSLLKAGESITFSSKLKKKSLAPHKKQHSSQFPHLNSSHKGGISKLDTGIDDKISSESGISLSKLRKRRVSCDCRNEPSSQTTRVEDIQAEEHYLGQNNLRGDENDRVFILPKCSSKKSCSEMPNDASWTFMHPNETPAKLSQGQATDENALSVKPVSGNAIDTSESLDHETTGASTVEGKHSPANHRLSFSLCSIARNLSFSESSAVPHLRSGESDVFFSSDVLHSCPRPVRLDSNSESHMRRHSIDTSQSSEFRNYDASRLFVYPNERTLNMKSHANPIGTSKQLHQARHPSHNHRYSFGLGGLRRSSSLKEGSNVPRTLTYTPVKSFPLTSKVYDSLDHASINKANNSTRASSSPMRRLLNPLLKIRVAKPHPSADTVQPLFGKLNLTSEFESIGEKNKKASTVQALLQLTVKDGLPLFKLVHSNSDILVAMRKLSTYGKSDAVVIYTFYSVCEVKKSGGWKNQGLRAKKYGFSSNAVGHMKISSSKGQFTLREFVLYSAEADQELAAIVIPDGSSYDSGDHKNKGKEILGKEDINSSKKVGTEKLDSTIVIIPGGVHALPCKGVPSPLIDRWKSGGSCDCGGWDIGCKLRILSKENYRQCSNVYHFELFDQGATQDNHPMFSLRPLEKGNFSVEFSSSISLLQAFSICVAVESSQKSFDFFEMNNLSQEKWLQESKRVRERVPTKYVQSPPPSPIGRV